MKIYLTLIFLAFLVTAAFAENIYTVWKKKTEFKVGLNWDDNTESDLWTYSVYRSDDEFTTGTMVAPGIATNPITGVQKTVTIVDGDAMTTSSYIDSGLSAGVYYYTATAIDNSGNESLHSTVEDAEVGMEWY